LKCRDRNGLDSIGKLILSDWLVALGKSSDEEEKQTKRGDAQRCDGFVHDWRKFERGFSRTMLLQASAVIVRRE
jgi:hypothetical protein